MAVDNYRQVSFMISHKTLQRVDKLASEYGLSRANTLQRLIEESLNAHGEPLEDSSTFKDGEKNKHGRPKLVSNTLRNVL